MSEASRFMSALRAEMTRIATPKPLSSDDFDTVEKFGVFQIKACYEANTFVAMIDGRLLAAD